MSKYKESAFSLEGQFLEFVQTGGYKIKYMRVATSEGENWIELSKQSRASLFGHSLTPGDWIQISGRQQYKSRTGELNFKADRVIPVARNLAAKSVPIPAKPSKAKARILVCQKSDCRQRGSDRVCAALESALGSQGLADCVEIEKTGCLKQCKVGPNLIVMPDKARYNRVSPKQIPTLIEKHLSQFCAAT